MIGDALAVTAMAGILVGAVLLVSRHPLDPLGLFALMYAPKFVLRPAMLLFGLDTHERPFLLRADLDDLVRHALLVFGLATIAFAVGYGLAPHRLVRPLALALPGAGERTLNLSRLRWLAIALVCVATAVSLLLLRRAGSTAAFVAEARSGLFAGFAFLERLPLIASFAAGFLVLTATDRPSERIVSLLLYAVTLVLLFLQGDRGAILYSLFALVMSRIYLRTISWARLILAAVGLALLLLALGAARDNLLSAARRERSLWDTIEDVQLLRSDRTPVAQVADHLNLAPVDHFLVILQDFDASNFRLGEDYWTGLLGVVPRFLWPSKPQAITVGQWFRERYAPGSHAGKPITAIGNLYLNFGLAGVLVGLLLSGMLCRVLWEYMVESRFRPWAVGFTIVTFCDVLSWGVYTTVTPPGIVLWLIPLALLYRFVLIARAPQTEAPSCIPHGGIR